MRFTVFLTTFLVLSVSGWAQRGGGHGSFGGAHMGGGAHMAAGAHFGSGLSVHAGPAMPWNPGGPAGARNPWATTGNYGRVSQNYQRFAGRGTYRYYQQIPYLWSLYPNYSDPFLFDDSGYYDEPNYYSYPQPDAYDSGYGQYQPGPDPQTAYLAAQVQQLSNQLNAVEQQGVQPPMAQQAAPAAVAAVPLTLVLKDGRHLQVQNYAVMDHTFWDFTSQPVKKIPLSDIDIAASQRLSVANGAEFPNLTASNDSAQ